VKCPFGCEVGPRTGPWSCPLFDDHGECYCLQCACLYFVGEMDDRIRIVQEFWTPVYATAEHPWEVTMPELSQDYQP